MFFKKKEKKQKPPKKLSMVPVFAFFILVFAPLLIMVFVPKPSMTQPNIILFTIDTLRVGSIGAYGHCRALTPNIDFFAKKSVQFTSTITVAPETIPAHATLFTGRYPFRHQCLDNKFPLSLEELTLSEMLRKDGYETRAVTNAILSLYRGFEQGFQLYNGNTEDSMDKEQLLETAYQPFVNQAVVQDEKEKRDHLGASFTTDRAIRTCRTINRSPFFLWVHYWDPHSPYNPPEMYRKMFNCSRGSGREFLFPTELLTIHREKIELTEQEKEKLRALYDADIAYFDKEWCRFMTFLKQQSLLQKSCVVFVSDHGESLYEHDYYIGHGLSIKNTVLSIPLLISYEEGAHKIVLDQVKIADICPTILDLLTVNIKNVIFDGKSLLPHLGLPSRSKITPETGEVYSRANLLRLNSVQNKNWKIVSKDNEETVAAFCISDDPSEQRGSHISADQHPPQHLIEAIHNWKYNYQSLSMSPSKTKHDEELQHMLKNLGYVDQYPLEQLDNN